MSDDLLRVLDAEARLQEVERQWVEEAARMVIFRTEVARKLSEMNARIVAMERDHARLEATEEQIRIRSKRALMIEVTDEARKMIGGLPHRVETIEKCLVEIEARLGLRRKPKSQIRELNP